MLPTKQYKRETLRTLDERKKKYEFKHLQRRR